MEPGYWKKYRAYLVTKWLAFVCFLASFITFSELSHWPLSRQNLVEGLAYLGLIVACLLMSRWRLLLLGCVLGLFAGRGMIAFFITGHPLALFIATPAAVGVYLILRYRAHLFADLRLPPGYGPDEIILDLIAGFSIIGIIYVLRKTL